MISLFGKDKGEGSLLDRLKQSVAKTRSQLAARVEDIFRGEKQIDPAALASLENALLATDLGMRTTREVLNAVRVQLERNALRDGDAVKAAVKSQLVAILRAVPVASGNGSGSGAAAPPNGEPQVLFVVGVNSTGKTTTIVDGILERLVDEMGAETHRDCDGRIGIADWHSFTLH